MSGRPIRTSNDRGFGRYLEEAAIERTGHAEDRDEGAQTDKRDEGRQTDTSTPPRTGRRGDRADNGFGRYLDR